MTNREKFKEVYGFELESDPCVAPEKVCDHYGECGRCPFKGWWDKEYKKEEKAMTRTEAELAIVKKLKEIKEIALNYDRGIEYLSMSLRHYDGTDEYFDNEWVINFYADDHTLDAFVQGGEVYSGRVGSAGEIIAEGVTV